MKKIFLSAILAGAVIAFGGTVFLSVENTVVGSLFFTIGLFVVCTRGLHLFTGKVCYVFDNDMAYAKTLPVIWLGNLVGTSLIALAEKCTRLVSLSARAQGICELKLSEPLFGAFILAVFCNVMIYIGVEGYRSNPTSSASISRSFSACACSSSAALSTAWRICTISRWAAHGAAARFYICS